MRPCVCPPELVLDSLLVIPSLWRLQSGTGRLALKPQRRQGPEASEQPHGADGGRTGKRSDVSLAAWIPDAKKAAICSFRSGAEGLPSRPDRVCSAASLGASDYFRFVYWICM